MAEHAVSRRESHGVIITCLIGVAWALLSSRPITKLFHVDSLQGFFHISTWITALNVRRFRTTGTRPTSAATTGTAAVSGPLILLSQNRRADTDRIKAEHDQGVNRLALICLIAWRRDANGSDRRCVEQTGSYAEATLSSLGRDLAAQPAPAAAASGSRPYARPRPSRYKQADCVPRRRARRGTGKAVSPPW